MSPELSKTIESERGAIKRLATDFNLLFQTLEEKGLLAWKRIITGLETREILEKEVEIRIRRQRDLWALDFEICKVAKNKLVKEWLGNLEITVPVSTRRSFWGKNPERTFYWTDPRTIISLRTTIEEMIKLPLTAIPDNPETFEQVIKIVSFINSVLSGLNGHRETVTDLTGRTLVID